MSAPKPYEPGEEDEKQEYDESEEEEEDPEQKIIDIIVGDPLGEVYSEEESIKLIRKILDDNTQIDINQIGNIDDETPFYLAAEKGWVNLARLLKERGANPLQKAFNDLTPLHAAVGQAHVEMVEFLIKECGASVLINSIDTDGNTPINIAAELENEGDKTRMLAALDISDKKVTQRKSRFSNHPSSSSRSSSSNSSSSSSSSSSAFPQVTNQRPRSVQEYSGVPSGFYKKPEHQRTKRTVKKVYVLLLWVLMWKK